MPIAFFLVAMISLIGGWYQMENHTREQETIQKSEAQAVAANITSYHLKVMKCARVRDDSNNALHWDRFLATNGTAQQFLSGCTGVPGLSWVEDPFPGVSMTIAGGQVTVNYTPTTELHAPRRGVQAELNRMTHNSITLGQPIWGY